ncbi:MAG: alpha/beta hydrolase [Planctomycetaceae bacterium]|nr:alpha/beta hydrolase [Planctomycetaceae bacterium]
MKLFYHEQGTGRTVVFLHGFPMDHTLWTAVSHRLSASYHVVTPDLRGFGRTPAENHTATMEAMADDISELIQTQLKPEEPIVLCGLSMGGYVAMPFVRKYPHLLAGLILTNTRTTPDSPDVAANRLRTAEKLLTDGVEPLVAMMIPNLLGEWTLENEPEIVQNIRRMMLAQSPPGLAAAARGMAQRPDTTELLPKIPCPVLTVCGEEDRISPPSEMDEMSQKIQNAVFSVIPKAGHLPPMENPRPFCEIVENFLQNILQK